MLAATCWCALEYLLVQRNQLTVLTRKVICDCLEPVTKVCFLTRPDYLQPSPRVDVPEDAHGYSYMLPMVAKISTVCEVIYDSHKEVTGVCGS